MTTHQVLFVLVPRYAEWESALLAAGLQWGFGLWESAYEVKTVSPDGGLVESIGGFNTMADYSLKTAPDDCAAVILVGGTGWLGPDAGRVAPLVEKAAKRGAVVGGICDGAVFLAKHGFVNGKRHTANDPEVLIAHAGPAYTAASLFESRQSVVDGRLVTANATGYAEFARDVLTLLEAGPPEKIAELYRLCKHGYHPGL